MNLNIITEKIGGQVQPNRNHISALVAAHPNHLRSRLAIVLQSLAGAFLVALLFDGVPASADEPADQLERARLIREQEEAQPPATSGSVTVPSLPGATLQTSRRATEGLRRQQLDDSQWRRLLGEQQMQVHQLPAGQPLAGAGAESQWRAQSFERERQAQDLSADILRRDQEFRQGMRH